MMMIDDVNAMLENDVLSKPWFSQLACVLGIQVSPDCYGVEAWWLASKVA